MAGEEWERGESCAQCGAAVDASSDRSFAFGAGNQLCWTCATERGGRYDAGREAWSVRPDVADLPDEAYGASPHERRRVRR